MTNHIETKNLTVFRQGKTILKDISLNIAEHGFITIIGPNGAGKSMLLKCLIGLFPIDSGTVWRKKGLKIGYMPQRTMLNLLMPINVSRFLSLRQKASREEIAMVVEETAIEHLRNTPLHLLSDGDLQRVLLARSLLRHPHILVLDEPAQNLDLPGQMAFYRLIEKIYTEKNLSIVMVSHDLHMVMASSKQVICLDHHICCSGEPHAVTQSPEFISLFGKDFVDMMAVYHHHSHKSKNV